MSTVPACLGLSIHRGGLTTPSHKLFQKSDVPLKEQLDIVNFILEHSDALYAHAKSKATDFVRIVAVTFYEFEDCRVHHPAAQQLDPSAVLA